MSEVADITAPPTASEMLKQAREAVGLSQDQVAQELYLTPSYIRMIDNDEIDKIAKQAFVRGYLRSYAKLVHIDGDAVVARFEQTQDGTPQKIEIRGVTREPVGSTNFTGPVFQTGILGLAGLVVVIGLVWYLTSSDDTPAVTVGPAASSSSDVGDSNNQTDTAAVEAPLVDSIEADSLEADSLETGAPETETPLPGVSVSESSIATRPATDSGETAPVTQTAEFVAENFIQAEAAPANQSDALSLENTALESGSSDTVDALPQVSNVSGRQITIERSNGVISVEAGGTDELRFFFSDECWVEIEDAEGNAIYGDLNRTGDELVVSGIAPFEVLFGKAPAVTMEYNGVPIDLIPHTTSVDTAKLKVGN